MNEGPSVWASRLRLVRLRPFPMPWPMLLASAFRSCPSHLIALWRHSIKVVAMRAFEYASPNTKEQVIPLLGRNWGEVEVLAGGTDLLALMKDDITTPKRLVNIKEIADLRGVSRGAANNVRLGALATL